MSINTLDLMRKRLQHHGGIRQEDRMIKDKWRGFKGALEFSYQGADVSLVQKYNSCDQLKNQELYRALINPDKTKQDYDDKILSIDYNTSFGPGDIFNWKGTNTNWIIYLRALTEDAYFRGEIRRCKYIIKFKDKNGNEKQTWAAIRGPVETQIENIQKNQIRIDKPNLSLNILIPKNEDTLYAFDRYSRFLLDGKAWQVQAPDTISMENVLELNAEEYYIDRDADDVDNEIAEGLIIESIDPNPQPGEGEIIIEGLTFIKPKITEVYKAPAEGGTWSVKESNYPVCLKVTNEPFVSVTWNKSVSGQFTLQWSKDDITLEKIVVVESLF